VTAVQSVVKHKNNPETSHNWLEGRQFGGGGETRQKWMQGEKKALEITMPVRFYWKETDSGVPTVEKLIGSNK
jgi:hypothetical protein